MVGAREVVTHYVQHLVWCDMEGSLELDLEDFTSAQLTELIIAAGRVLRERETARDLRFGNPRPETESRRDASEVPSGSAQPGSDGDVAGYPSQPRPPDGTGEASPEQKRKASPKWPPASRKAPPPPPPSSQSGPKQAVPTRDAQPYSNGCTIEKKFSLYPEGVPPEVKPSSPPPKASSTAAQRHGASGQGDDVECKKRDLIRTVRLLHCVENFCGVEQGWYFALQLPMAFTRDSIAQRQKALRIMLHPDKNGHMFDAIQDKNEKQECIKVSGQAYLLAEEAVIAAMKWFDDHPSEVDRKEISNNRPDFEQFHDGCLPEFFKSGPVPRPQALRKAPPAGFERPPLGEPPYVPRPRAKYPPERQPG